MSESKVYKHGLQNVNLFRRGLEKGRKRGHGSQVCMGRGVENE